MLAEGDTVTRVKDSTINTLQTDLNYLVGKHSRNEQVSEKELYETLERLLKEVNSIEQEYIPVNS